MNSKDMKYNLTFCLIFFTLPIWAQLLPTKVEVDSVFNSKCNVGDYFSASQYIVDCAIKRQDIGDKNTALDYQLKNCELIEKHIDYFNEKGLTIDEYFYNWETVSFLYRDLGYLDECISIYLNIINQMKDLAPDMLPSYSSVIATSFSNCTSERYRDSVYSLSLAMDYITRSDYSKEDVKDFIWMSHCFNINRFYNSINSDNVRFSDRLSECEPWFTKYKWFIDSLDKVVYGDDIVRYYVQQTDILYILASTLGSQENRYLESIYYLNKGISYLEQIKELNDTIPVKMASFYTEIANNYHDLGDKAMFKEYCDKAIETIGHLASLENKVNNLDYCDTMSKLALNYWYLKLPQTASLLKAIDIKLRKESPRPPTCSDYALLMMYNTGDTLSNINLGKELEEKYGNSDSSMAYVFLYMADAFSKKMHLALCNGDNESAKLNKNLYEEYIGKTKNAIQLYKQYYEDYGLLPNLLGSLYDVESAYYGRVSNMEKSYIFSKKALEVKSTKSYFDISIKSAAIHDKNAIHTYLPLYYEELVADIKNMLPLLGSVESGNYLGHGLHPLYRIPEVAQWNPNDSVCASIAYDASLIMKGLYQNYSSFASAIGNDNQLNKEYAKLGTLKDSIYNIKDNNSRMIAFHNYELKERAFRIKVGKEQFNNFFLDWKDIQSCLKEREIAIEFVCYNKNNYTWINDTKCKHYIALLISKKHKYPIVVDLFDEAKLFSVYKMQPKSYETNDGLALYNLLWGQLSPYLENCETIFFSPMGMLNLINIEALTDDKGRSAYDIYSLRRLSSTRQLLNRNIFNPLSNIALFGAIDYTTSAKKLDFTLDSLNTRGNWAYLSGTKVEIENITKECSYLQNMNYKSFTGSQATEDNFKKYVSSNPNIIHIATHGFYIPEDKRNNIPYYKDIDYASNLDEDLFYSGLVFANGQESWNNSTFQFESNDGILTSYEISKLNLHKCNLVILSACETGIGFSSYDGIIGLERGFKMAGARSLIMSLWKVDDEATSFMMTNFYKKLFKTHSVYDAFISAQKVVKDKYPDPYYWASFVLID